MKKNSLAEFARSNGYVPLAWAGSTSAMDYINIGDALSPVMVALMSGLPIKRVPSKSKTLRLASVGTIGHGFEGGEVHFWGTGASLWANPSAPESERRRFFPSAQSNFNVWATRGPISQEILGGKPDGCAFGDPVWLLPRFYRPKIEKKWKLGIIVHLSELVDRATEAHLRPELVRYAIPDDLKDDLLIINTVGPISVDTIRDKLDAILACDRIISTSLHGMVFAEAYGIPCLYFAPSTTFDGLTKIDLKNECPLDLRIIDLYLGMGLKSLSVYAQSNGAHTDWDDLIQAVDRSYEPKTIDEDALIDAFPLEYQPISSQGVSIWENPLLQSITLQHDVRALTLADRDNR